MGTQIFVAGDCHGRFDHVVEAAQAYLPAAVILLGDMEAQAPLDQVLSPILGLTAVHWIVGNHDTDSEQSYDYIYGSALAAHSLDSRVVEIAGLRIAGLGGVFREKVWAPPAAPLFQSAEDFVRRCGRGNRWRDGLPLKHRSTIFPSDYRRLLKQRADVLVTHEAPGCHRNGFPALDQVAHALRVRVALHGHHHETYQAQIAGGVRVIGVGLREIVDLDGQVIVPAEPA
jgi:predicted phosphodiesterase